MRVGQNPAKSLQQVENPHKITVAVVTNIPFLSGYYAQSLDVLKLSLRSLRLNTSEPFDLLVFDNASGGDTRAFLQDQFAKGNIQYLTLSDRNIGKGGAWNFIFGAAPGEIIAYADSDIYYRQGWLSESLKLMDGFPNTGMVTSRPLRSKERYYSKTLEWADQHNEVVLEKGKFLSWDEFSEHTLSCGVSVEQTEEWFHESHDWRLAYNGLIAFAGAAHFQFIAKKPVLQSLLPFEMQKPMGQVRTLDEKINHMGFLRLMINEPLVLHMGNVIPTDKGQISHDDRTLQSKKRVWDWPPLKRLFMFAYHRIFHMYFNRAKD